MATTNKRCVDCVAAGITTNRKTPHPGPRCVSHHRVKRRRRKDYSHSTHISEMYGITSDEYQAIYAHQNGRCAICRKGTGATKRLSVDHDHVTGMVRGLLDQKCNRDVLGHFNDDIEALQRAIDYLKYPPALEVIGCRIVPLTGAPVRPSTPKPDGAKPTITDGGDTAIPTL